MKSIPLISVLFVLLGLVIACSETAPPDPVARLEHARRAAFDKRPFDPQEIALLADQLAEAYLHRADSLKGTPVAGDDYIKAAQLYEELQQYQRAIGVYDQLITAQPEHPEVGYAQFKKGYVYNQMGDTAQARFFYTQFLAQYPDHEFAPSAKGELQFLGIPLAKWDSARRAMQQEAEANK